jgi:hypothetical protein
MKLHITYITALSLAFATAAVHAQTTNINQNYDNLTPPASPGSPALAVRTAYVISTATNIVTGGSSGVAVLFNKNTATQSGYLEYNAGGAALSNMYISFDLANNAPSASITQQVTFGVGAWNSGSASVLNSSANRFFAVDFYQGLRNDMTLRGAGNLSLTSGVTYAANYLEHVQIWANDNDTTSINYIRPDNSAVATLGPNSVVFWINNALVLNETDGGYAFTNAANGNATLGRLGFTVTSANQANFLIDNLLATDVAVVPEPSTLLLCSSGLLGLLAVVRRRQRAFKE